MLCLISLTSFCPHGGVLHNTNRCEWGSSSRQPQLVSLLPSQQPSLGFPSSINASTVCLKLKYFSEAQGFFFLSHYLYPCWPLVSVRSISPGWNFSLFRCFLDFFPLSFQLSIFFLCIMHFYRVNLHGDVGCDLFYLSGPVVGNHITISLNGIICPLQTIILTNSSINMRILHFSHDENIGHFPHRLPYC